MDIALDPLTQDYAGGRVDNLANAVYLRLMTPLGGYWADATLGSRLHLLAREKDVARVSVLARQYAEQALQPLLDDGRAASITVTTQRPHDGRMLLSIEVVDAGGQRQLFEHPVKVA